MIRAIIAVIQGAIAGMIGMFIVGKSVDVATDERTHSAGRACCGCLVLAFGLLVIVMVGWGLWAWFSGPAKPAPSQSPSGFAPNPPGHTAGSRMGCSCDRGGSPPLERHRSKAVLGSTF